ncbi:MAG: LIC12162 family protein [Acidobacteria bacterium]|nr:LIC12162 family protein [Acidobacteriota bacterium]
MRHLITTADERCWKFDRPVLFLGEWCRRYDRRSVWERMDAAVAEPYGLASGQKIHDLAYVQELSNQLLAELAETLNRLHQTRHSVRFWNIALGRWLQRYVAVAFNRYFTLEQTLANHSVSCTTVLDASAYRLATPDSLAFIRACNDDVFNGGVYASILNFWGTLTMEPAAGAGNGPDDGSRAVVSRSAELSVRRVVADLVGRLLRAFSRDGDAFVINTYLPKIEEMALQVALGQCPQLWQRPMVRTIERDPVRREPLRLDHASHRGFERYVRLQLPDMIPTCYLEGYRELERHAQSVGWPARPKFILTSNNFDTDEVFKIWTASKVEEGTPYFAGQHGNNYGTLLGSQKWPERTTTDGFFTWGWTDDNPRTIPAFIFKRAGRQEHARPSPAGGLLLIELHVPDQVEVWDAVFEFGIYQDEQFRFARALPAEIRAALTVRLHAEHRHQAWFDEERWQAHDANVRIDQGMEPISRLIAHSRLVIHSYDSTGLLETLSANVPTICFWHGGLDHLLPNAKAYYEALRSGGILADSPEQAAEWVAQRWDRVSEWWSSRTVQDARSTFCQQWCRSEARPVRRMKRLLTDAIGSRASAGSRTETAGRAG